MTHLPLLTVVVPNLGPARFLPRFFRSLEAQTMDPAAMEVVVVDDGDTHGSPAGALRWARRLKAADFRFLAIHCQGLAGTARNVGLAHARGRFLVCLEPGDVLAPTFLSRCLDALEMNPGAALACTGWSRVGRAEARDMSGPELTPGLLATRNCLSPTALMRREVWEVSRGFADNTVYMDWDFWIQAEANGFRAVRVPGALYEQRVCGEDCAAPDRDGPAKAAVVLNNRTWFHPEVVGWARALERGEAWTETTLPGRIPSADGVRALRRRAAMAMARGLECNLDAASGSVSSAQP